MGTNFYAHRIPNEHERAEIHEKIDKYLNGDCMLDDVLNELSPAEKGLHLGKMSYGWQFLWCLNPDYYNDNLKSIRHSSLCQISSFIMNMAKSIR